MTEGRLSLEDQELFKNWINLNLMGISWEGRFLSEFNEFWDSLFSGDQSISMQFDQLDKMNSVLTEGPLISWARWLRDRFICYCFIYKDLSIESLAKVAKLTSSDIGTVLRDFFVERVPHLEVIVNEKFQIGNILSENLKLTFKDLSEQLSLPEKINGSLDTEVLNSLEITLYSDWKKLIDLTQAGKQNQSKIQTFRNKNFLTKQLKFAQELVFLFILGGVLIFLVKVGNKWYEDYLVKKISLFEPNFFWLDKNLSFQDRNELAQADLSIDFDKLEELEAIESKNVFKDEITTNRYEVESDVVLTSVDALPKDFDDADFEQSTYEEVKKGGYRNNRYGSRKAYRVMLTSVDSKKTKQDLISLLDGYGVKQVDNVKPGTEIPGGIYFNLNVPSTFLKEFLLKVSSVEESTILESKTSSRGPAGTSRVFIWIKSI